MGGSAPLLVIGTAVSIQTGLAIATTVFDSAGPMGALWLRTLLAAVLLALVARRSLVLVRARWRGIAVLGVVLAGMNLCFFEAIARMPLGLAATIEFLGPLAVAVIGIRRRMDVVWPLLAGVGVALLGSPSVDIPLAGGLFAAASAVCWATYIVLAKRVVSDTPPLPALVLAMSVGAVVLAPGALIDAPSAMWSWEVLGVALVVAVLASRAARIPAPPAPTIDDVVAVDLHDSPQDWQKDGSSSASAPAGHGSNVKITRVPSTITTTVEMTSRVFRTIRVPVRSA